MDGNLIRNCGFAGTLAENGFEQGLWIQDLTRIADCGLWTRTMDCRSWPVDKNCDRGPGLWTKD